MASQKKSSPIDQLGDDTSPSSSAPTPTADPTLTDTAEPAATPTSAPAPTTPTRDSPNEGFAIPDIARFNPNAAQVDESLSWSGIRRYKIEKGLYQLEMKGVLSGGKLVTRKTKMLRAVKSKWRAITLEELIENYDFEVVTSGNEFTVYLKLPKGKFQVTLVAKIDGRSQEYPFEIEPNESWPDPPPPSLGLFLCGQCGEFGTGLNYLSLSHSNVSTLAPINYSAVAVPSLNLQYRRKLTRTSGLRLILSQNKGADFAPTQITMKNSAVALSTLSLGYDRITKPNGTLFGVNYSSGYLYSFNTYVFPMVRVLDQATATYSTQTFNVYSASAGGFFGLNVGGSEFIAQMRLQVPLSATSVTFKGGLSFDGALTYLKPFTRAEILNASNKVVNGSYWGVTWGGQYHRYTYDLPNESLSGGTYSVFLSKIELLMGYAF